MGPGSAEIHLPCRRAVTQHDASFHSGVIATLADNSGGAAGCTLLTTAKALLTVEFKLNILAPGRGERLIARGRVARSGCSLVIGASDVFAVEGGVETHCATELTTHCATALTTLMVIDRRG